MQQVLQRKKRKSASIINRYHLKDHPLSFLPEPYHILPIAQRRFRIVEFSATCTQTVTAKTDFPAAPCLCQRTRSSAPVRNSFTDRVMEAKWSQNDLFDAFRVTVLGVDEAAEMESAKNNAIVNVAEQEQVF
ncbi:hypothetical protein J6590_003935 [Homalodisca vitripennis]|nr:hypothetical protein J6590_003935 [Homalodisca vitripennis]